MNTFYISRNDGADIGQKVSDLDAEAVLAFLEETADIYLYSVGEYDDDNQRVERLNGEEWLHKHTEMRRCLK